MENNHQNSQLKAFVYIDKNSDFPIQNLPIGIFKAKKLAEPRAGVRLGDFVIDLSVLEDSNLLVVNEGKKYFNKRFLNDFVALGTEYSKSFRAKLTELFAEDSACLREHGDILKSALHPYQDVEMLVPLDVGDYTDFYSSEVHARNVGAMFRDKDNALTPNWKHLPIGYHGRASSIIISGEPIYRPCGQVRPKDSAPVFQPTAKLDFELEMAFFVSTGNPRGTCIPVKNASDHIFGFVLVNDWSARDIQAWEYVPLGPFLAKSFATSISPWIVMAEALEPFKVHGPEQEPVVMDYLIDNDASHYNIALDIMLQTSQMTSPQLIASTNYNYMYWSVRQQIAHHTIAGCNLNTGDMLASGTISGPERNQFGSMLELTQNGTQPILLDSGEQRGFLEDHDKVIFHAYASCDAYRIGFGELENTVLPSRVDNV